MLLDRYRFVDFARKVVGVGSVGTRCWSRCSSGPDSDDPLFLQVKEAEASVLGASSGRQRVREPGDRVVAGQRLMQAASDILLGWARGGSTRARDFTPPAQTGRATSWSTRWRRRRGRSTADVRLDARSRARPVGDRIAIAGYLGAGERFDEAIAKFAGYAEPNERDHEALVRAVRSGRVHAETETRS